MAGDLGGLHLVASEVVGNASSGHITFSGAIHTKAHLQAHHPGGHGHRLTVQRTIGVEGCAHQHGQFARTCATVHGGDVVHDGLHGTRTSGRAFIFELGAHELAVDQHLSGSQQACLLQQRSEIGEFAGRRHLHCGHCACAQVEINGWVCGVQHKAQACQAAGGSGHWQHQHDSVAHSDGVCVVEWQHPVVYSLLACDCRTHYVVHNLVGCGW